MKRFLLFAYDHYYPNGGLADLQGNFDTLDEALESYKNQVTERLYGAGYDYVEVLDTQTGEETEIHSRTFEIIK